MASMSKADIGRFLARQGILVAFAVFIIGFTLAKIEVRQPQAEILAWLQRQDLASAQRFWAAMENSR